MTAFMSNGTSALIGNYNLNGFFYLPGATQTDGAPTELMKIIHPHWSDFPPQNQLWNSIIAVVYTLLCFVNAIGNVLILIIILKVRSLRTPSNMLAANLAFTDFCMMMSQGPLLIINSFRARLWSFGVLACEVYGFTAGLFGVAAIFSMVAIGCDRYFIINDGISAARRGPLINKLKAVVLIILIWICSLGINLPPLLKVWSQYTPEGLLTTCSFDYLRDDWNSKSYVLFIFTFAFIVPLLLLMYFYSKILSRVWIYEKTLKLISKRLTEENLTVSASDPNQMKIEIEITKSSICSLIIWVTTWTPYAITVMIGAFGNRMQLTPLVSMLPAIVAKTSSCVNPVVFGATHPHIKLALQEIFSQIYCLVLGKPNEDSEAMSNNTNTVKMKVKSRERHGPD